MNFDVDRIDVVADRSAAMKVAMSLPLPLGRAATFKTFRLWSRLGDGLRDSGGNASAAVRGVFEREP